MRIGHLGFGSALLFSLISASPASAQRVEADIRIGGRGPISGHIRIGDRYGRDDWRRDYGRARRIQVEVFRRRDRGWHNGWFKQFRRHARVVVVYYDRRDDCYYDRRFHPGLQEIDVYERNGRYYRSEFDGYYDRDGRGRRDGRDGWDDRDRRDGRDGWDDRDRRDGRDGRDDWDRRDGRNR